MSKYRSFLIGEGGVGRTALVVRFTQGCFIEEYDPTIEDNYRKEVTIDGEACLLEMLDTSGREDYAPLRDQYVRACEGFLVVYSITSRQSFEKVVSDHRERILRVKEAEWVPFVLVGNKSDLDSDRQVSTEEGKELAKQWQVPFFETSAKDSTNITECFTELVRQVKKARLAKPELPAESNQVKHKQSKCSIL